MLPEGVSDEAAFESLLEAACHRRQLVEAMTDVIVATSGVVVHQCLSGTGMGDARLLCDSIVFEVGDRVAVHQIREADAMAWSPGYQESPYLLSARREALEAALRSVRAVSGVPEQVLRIPHFSLIQARSQAAGALSMWWHDRMREGHTAESARVLLGMTMDPLMWAELVWVEDAGAAPRFGWCRTTVHEPPDPFAATPAPQTEPKARS